MASPFPRTIDATFADQLGTEIVTILVGPNEKKYTVHKNLLVLQSDYFDKALNGGFREAGENTIHLEEDDPAAIALLIAWLYRSVIPGAPSKSVYSVGAFPPSQSQIILPNGGTKIKVPHHTERDSSRVGFGAADTLVYTSIVAHPRYVSYSAEELRLADYRDGRKDATFPASIDDEGTEEPPSTRPGGLFSDNSLFVGNPPSLFGPPTNSGLFGYPPSTQGGGLFGGGFGTTNPHPTTAAQTTAFGAPASQGSLFGGGFGTVASPPTTATPTSQGGGLFGGGFGTTNPPPTTAQTTAFGAPNSTAPQTTSLFGRQPGWPNATPEQNATSTTQPTLFGSLPSLFAPQFPSLLNQIPRSNNNDGNSRVQSSSPATGDQAVATTLATTTNSTASPLAVPSSSPSATPTNVVESTNNDVPSRSDSTELDRRPSANSASTDSSRTPSTSNTPRPPEGADSSTAPAAVATSSFPTSAVGSHTSSANTAAFSLERPRQYPHWGPSSTSAPAFSTLRSGTGNDALSPFSPSSTEKDAPKSFERPINPGFDNVVAPFGNHTTPEHQDALLHLVLFAEATCWPMLYNAAITEYIAGERALARPPALEHITLIYDRTHEESTLRTWVIDIFAGFKGNVDRSGYMSLLVEYEGFLEGVVQKLREWGKDAHEDKGFDGAGGLKYKMMDHDKKSVFGKGKEKEKGLKF